MSHTKNVPNVVASEAPTAPIEKPPQTGSPPDPVPPVGQGHSCVPPPSLPPNFLSAPSPTLVHPSPTPPAEDMRRPSPISASSLLFELHEVGKRNSGNGMSNLHVVQQRGRKNLAASFQNVARADHASLGVPPSSATYVTAAATPAPHTTKVSVDKGDGNDALPTVVHINSSDDHTDPTPFAFKPYVLAALVDPKTLKDLDKMGGLEGLCTGLGTNPTKGLSAHSLGQGAGADGEKSGGEGPLAAPLSDRQRVYGTNSPPTRRSKLDAMTPLRPGH